MKIKCYNYNQNGTWIIDTVREFRKALRSESEYKNISDYNKVILDDVVNRIKEKIISKYEIVEL